MFDVPILCVSLPLNGHPSSSILRQTVVLDDDADLLAPLPPTLTSPGALSTSLTDAATTGKGREFVTTEEVSELPGKTRGSFSPNFVILLHFKK